MAIKIAIIGRPNVGKSTLFNKLAGRRTAIVHDKPGVTRDRIETKGRLNDIDLALVDTAGFEYSVEPGALEKRLFSQTEKAIGESDAVLFLFDARAGLHPHDELFAGIVRKAGKPVVLLANKCEGRLQEDSIHEAYKLGLGEPVPFSAEHGIGFSDLYDALLALESEGSAEDLERSEDKPIQLAIVGRPNVGKSTLVNALLGDERMLTGPEAGLTRDAVTVDWAWRGHRVKLVDTAGLRKQARVSDSLEKLSAASTKAAAFTAQVVVLVLDADAVLEKQDLTIARKVIEEGRALVIAVNKWDVAADQKESLERLKYKLRTSFAQAEGVPVVTISALKKKGLGKLMDEVLAIYEKWNMRIATARLNQWFGEMIDAYPPPLGKNKRRIKLRYITQAKSRPPAFFIFSSNPEGLPESYLRYIAGSLRKSFDLWGIPIRITVRKGKNPFAEES